MSHGTLTPAWLGAGVGGWGWAWISLVHFLYAESESLRYFLQITQHVQTQGHDWNPVDSGVLGNQLSPQDEGRGRDEVLGAGYLTACPAESALPSAAAPAPDGPRGTAEPLQCGDTHNVEELVLRQQPQGQTHPALALMAPIPWSFRLSSSFSCSRQRSFRSRGANCSELLSGPGLGRAGQHKLAENHPPASSILQHPAFIHLRNAHCAPALYPSLGFGLGRETDGTTPCP